MQRWAASREVSYIILTGVAVRLALLVIVDPGAQPFSGDTLYYAEEARRLWALHLPDGFRAPLYSLFLALTLPAGWAFPMAAQSALTITGGLAAFWTFKGRVGLISGVLIAGCPFFALYDFKLLSETLYVQLGWYAVLCTYSRKWMLSGLLWGLAVLARDSLALLPLLISGLLAIRGEWRAGWIAVLAYATLLPWVVATGSLSQGRAGINLWVGTWERNGEWAAAGFKHPSFPSYAFTSPSEKHIVETAWLRNDDALLRVAKDRIRTHPIGTLIVWAERYPRLWIGTRSDQIDFRLTREGWAWKVAKALFLGVDLCLVAFGVWGAAQPDGYKVLLVPVLYVAIIYVPFHTEIRFSLSALPSLLTLGPQRLLQRRNP